MSKEIECRTVEDLLSALRVFPIGATVISSEPPFSGVRVVRQDSGSVLICRPRLTSDDDPGLKSTLVAVGG